MAADDILTLNPEDFPAGSAFQSCRQRMWARVRGWSEGQVNVAKEPDAEPETVDCLKCTVHLWPEDQEADFRARNYTEGDEQTLNIRKGVEIKCRRIDLSGEDVPGEPAEEKVTDATDVFDSFGDEELKATTDEELGESPETSETKTQAETRAPVSTPASATSDGLDIRDPSIDLAKTNKDFLRRAGYVTLEQVAAATDEELLAIPRIGPRAVKMARAAAEKLLGADGAAKDTETPVDSPPIATPPEPAKEETQPTSATETAENVAGVVVESDARLDEEDSGEQAPNVLDSILRDSYELSDLLRVTHQKACGIILDRIVNETSVSRTLKLANAFDLLVARVR